MDMSWLSKMYFRAWYCTALKSLNDIFWHNVLVWEVGKYLQNVFIVMLVYATTPDFIVNLILLYCLYTTPISQNIKTSNVVVYCNSGPMLHDSTRPLWEYCGAWHWNSSCGCLVGLGSEEFGGRINNIKLFALQYCMRHTVVHLVFWDFPAWTAVKLLAGQAHNTDTGPTD